MSSPLMQAINQISEEKNIPAASVIETIEAALAAAYRKDFGEKNQNIKVEFDAETGAFDVFDVKTVVEDQELPVEEEPAPEEEGPRARGAAAERREPEARPAQEGGAAEGEGVEEEKKF